ncbi:MAG: sulfurtransferase [Gammaproteobacteria bacterium]|nr:sulfurtransferase [Gammaproteobacteria bacterium]MDH3435054.1 sulfurtransferase [Gammaproteobacteria bacterium]
MNDQSPVISAEQLETSLGSADLRIVDCRFELTQADAGRNSYLRGHIPGAVYADLDKDLAAPVTAMSGRHPLPDAAALALTFGQMGISRNTGVVVYDDCSGAVAARAWWLLRWLGHERVAVLEGGFARWKSLQLPIEKGEVVPVAREFLAEPRAQLVIETAEIMATPAESLRLVDARDAARFRGEAEPIDRVAGHIPGSVNLPFSASLNADGSWKDERALRDQWDDVLGDDSSRPFAVMCGSGVTACHLVISALLAGLPEPRLYVGSWSEWIGDPARTVATGAA